MTFMTEEEVINSEHGAFYLDVKAFKEEFITLLKSKIEKNLCAAGTGTPLPFIMEAVVICSNVSTQILANSSHLKDDPFAMEYFECLDLISGLTEKITEISNKCIRQTEILNKLREIPTGNK